MAAVAAAVALGGGLLLSGLSYLSRQQMPKQQLGEISAQTAREGEPRLIVWGIVRPIGGNLVTPRKLFRRVRRSNPPVVAGIYAIGVCEGPITGFRRIWRNEKLVYDNRPGSEWGARNNPTFLKNYRLYMGDWDQMPDPTLQAAFGADAIPPFRGTAYMVAGLRGRGEDLSDTGGAVPQWRFEVERAYGEVLTTALYPYETADEMAVSGGFVESYLSGKGAETDDAATVTPGYAGHVLAGKLLDDEDTATVVPGYVGHLLAGKLYDTDDAATVTPGYAGHVLAGVGTEQSDTATVTPGYVGATIE